MRGSGSQSTPHRSSAQRRYGGLIPALERNMVRSHLCQAARLVLFARGRCDVRDRVMSHHVPHLVPRLPLLVLGLCKMLLLSLGGGPLLAAICGELNPRNTPPAAQVPPTPHERQHAERMCCTTPAKTLRGDTAALICTISVCRVRSIDKRCGHRTSPPPASITRGGRRLRLHHQRPRNGQRRQRLVSSRFASHRLCCGWKKEML
ncbi:hypothetical protein CC86DRAFT_388657 [Ophiobolus disseminans]|uniref:Uncharacterized protein n=1 Tax=Ophiobolus disseminans TaxID=1469910 RepID=A0A6A6ZCZ2_9PLEO|nr:hypothetical protein CC86DRAFT_388657 [Ophiobolus disseminans]